MPKKSLGGRTVGRPPATHRDEFPAEYSLAGCSPAEPASAFSAMLILNQKLTRWLELFSERLLSPNRAVSIHAAVQRYGTKLVIKRWRARKSDCVREFRRGIVHKRHR